MAFKIFRKKLPTVNRDAPPNKKTSTSPKNIDGRLHQGLHLDCGNPWDKTAPSLPCCQEKFPDLSLTVWRSTALWGN